MMIWPWRSTSRAELIDTMGALRAIVTRSLVQGTGAKTTLGLSFKNSYLRAEPSAKVVTEKTWFSRFRALVILPHGEQRGPR